LVGTYVIITLKSFVLQRKYRTDALIIFHYIDEGVQLEKPVDAIEKLKQKNGGSAKNEHERPSHLFRPMELIVLTSGNIFQQDGRKKTGGPMIIQKRRQKYPSADQEFLILCGIYGVFVFGPLFLLSLCSHEKNN
jgi:hypothetical protein